MLGLVLAFAPASVWAVDSDGDGLDDDQVEAGGFFLPSGYDLWDAAARDWKRALEQPEGAVKVYGANECDASGSACLSITTPDLFVIWSPGAYIDLQACDLFALATKPISAGGLGFNIWVLGKNGAPTPDDRTFSSSTQKAVVLVEDMADNVTVTGFSQYATIMVEGKGQATIYSQIIVNNIEAAAVIDGNVQSESGVGYCPDTPYGDNCLQCLHFQNTAIHEILHVMDTLDNTLKRVYSHHLTRGEYIMKPAIVYTEKKGKVTYYIPEEASSTTQANWDFNP
jgi:hypothetical protein